MLMGTVPLMLVANTDAFWSTFAYWWAWSMAIPAIVISYAVAFRYAFKAPAAIRAGRSSS